MERSTIKVDRNTCYHWFTLGTHKLRRLASDRKRSQLVIEVEQVVWEKVCML